MAALRDEGAAILILTRKLEQSFVIDGGITVVVLGVERDRVKLGIAAPDGTKILRTELIEAKKCST